jgi:hypothetical protein
VIDDSVAAMAEVSITIGVEIGELLEATIAIIIMWAI